MRLIQKLLAALGFGLVTMAVGASPASPVNGVDYRTLDKVQPTDSGKKVEVTEFFWYACPHCSAFEPALEDWVKKQGDKIVFKRVPIAFSPSFAPQQKLYYTLEAMGKVDELHQKVFNAIHVSHQSLNTDKEILAFVEKQGVDKKKFLDLYNSFGVQTKVNRVTQLQQAYKVDGVPLVAIEGRYLTSPSIVGTGNGNQSEVALETGALQVMSWLVDKASKEQKAQAADDAKQGKLAHAAEHVKTK